MIKEWQELIQIVGEKSLLIEKIRLKDSDIVIEGYIRILRELAFIPV